MKEDNVRKCHLCDEPTENKYCVNETCEVNMRDESEGALNEDELTKYVKWILEESETPINEIEWLVKCVDKGTQNDIRNNVLKFLN